jgi:hypothetical protein
MKRLFIILISAIVFLSACNKEATVRTSGTDTIDNLRYQTISYHVYGFSFSQAKLVATPKHDIVIDLIHAVGVPLRPALQANNLLPSFFKVDEFDTEDEAKKAFDDLKNITAMVEQAGLWLNMANPVAPNQIWLYRSNDEKYTKIRIVEVKNEKREQFFDYAECTFQWVHQPDGTLTFP